MTVKTAHQNHDDEAQRARKCESDLVGFDFSTSDRYSLCFDGRYLRLFASPYGRAPILDGIKPMREITCQPIK